MIYISLGWDLKHEVVGGSKFLFTVNIRLIIRYVLLMQPVSQSYRLRLSQGTVHTRDTPAC